MTHSFIFRPVRASDLPAILEIVGQTGPGFNTLANHAKAMEEKIHWSLNSFAGNDLDKPKFYFFVLQDLNTATIIGTSGIEANIGNPWPFYKFKVSHLVQTSKQLNLFKKHRILQLVTEHENATELGALYLKPSYRGKNIGTFLSRARCLFIAEFQHLFSDKIIADLRGVSNATEASPFWEALGQHFFGMTYQEACHLKAVAGSQFLMDLVPHYPIYVDFLSANAQSVIGKTHEQALPAWHVLEKEGFQFKNHIDIFDGGPTIETSKNRLRSVVEAKQGFIVGYKDKLPMQPVMLIGNAKRDYRAGLGTVELTNTGEVMLEPKVAEQLNLAIGDQIRFCPLR